MQDYEAALSSSALVTLQNQGYRNAIHKLMQPLSLFKLVLNRRSRIH